MRACPISSPSKMFLCWELLCATLLVTATAASGPAVLPRRYLNTTSSDESQMTQPASPLPNPPSIPPATTPPSTPSSAQSSSTETSSYSLIPFVLTLPIPSPTFTTTSCGVFAADAPHFVYIILPNPNTVVVTVGTNYTTPSLKPKVPEFTPPAFCPEETPTFTTASTKSSSATIRTSRKIEFSTSIVPAPTVPVLTEPVPSEPIPTIIDATVLFSVTEETTPPPTKTPKIKVSPPTTTIITTSKNPVTIYTTVSPPTYPGGGDGIEKQTVDPAIGGGPNDNSGIWPTDSPRAGSIQDGHISDPITTTIQGIPVEIQPSYVVVGGVTHSYVEATKTGTRSAPESTNMVIVNGGVFSAIGSSIAVLDGQTLQYGSLSTFTTEYHRETITLGASISFDGTTLGGAANTGTQIGIAGGISVTQVGQSVAVISSTSLTVGPQAVVTTVFIDTYTIIANAGGLELYGTTLAYPFITSSLTLTFGGITFTKIGSSIMVVSGTTYTIQPTSTTTTKSFNRQTISLGSKGSVSATMSLDSERPAQTTKSNGNQPTKPMYVLLGIGIIACIWNTL